MEAADQPRSERIRLYDSGLGTNDHFDGERDWNIRTLSTIYEVPFFLYDSSEPFGWLQRRSMIAKRYASRTMSFYGLV